MMNYLNRFIVFISAFISTFLPSDASLKDDLLWWINENSIGTGIVNNSGSWIENGTSVIDAILLFVKDSIFWLLGLISIGMFLYVGFKLIKAEWNPEEMKWAFVTLTYVIVWLFIVAISWAVIKIVTGLNF